PDLASYLEAERARLDQLYTLDVSQYKSPLDTPEESQWGISVFRHDNSAGLRLRWLPVSHGINDDNRQYFSENELKLSEFTFEWDVRNERLRLHEWQLYSMRSYIPYDLLTGGISGRFSVSMREQYDASLEADSAAAIEGAIGFTHSWHPAIDTYLLIGGGLGHDGDHGYAYGFPELGVIARLARNYKTHVNLQRVWQQRHADIPHNALEIVQAKHWSDWALLMRYENRWNTRQRDEQFALELRRYY
ncbi:MAG: hypothetical protein R3183_14535, partial [Oleiphilaceae bacterium]|nr:hypothetical protein [Oleiphilaceae bacterium]